MIQRLHVIGDRQAGKTELGLAYASSLIHNGVNVALYTYGNNSYVRNLVDRYEMHHIREDTQKLYRSNGAQRVRDDSSRATLYFTTARSDSDRFRGIHIGTVILDEHLDWEDFIFEMRHPGLTHIVRTVL